MWRFASWSRTGFVPPPGSDRRRWAHHRLARRDRLYRRPSLDLRTIPVDWETIGETEMAVDGNWNIVMTTPMGERKATLTLKNSGGTLTGTQGADGNSGDIFDGTANGDDVAWKISITNPMPLTLAFTGKVTGDSIAGEMGIGPMGSFPFTATRAEAIVGPGE